ncbi:hypothetical protein CPB84DRAFT_1843732 [Gymnopilus junonius]|uniref:Uncharacterized protein n=1 Tax=Gymnopilus junonius TaxID=109634 RepID=A0A9P5NWN6_GYMJU|nr:hypothetical protein CPB84DRAFT_1843732 [Gymnopilus junonius]
MMKGTTRPQARIQSFSVTCHFAERSTTIKTRVSGSSTLPEVRSRIAAELAQHLGLQEADVEATGIIIASDDKGFLPYDTEDEDTLLSDVVGDQAGIHAIVPSKISQAGLDAGVPTSVITESPSFLSDPLTSSWNARMMTLGAQLKADLLEEQERREAKLREEQKDREAKLREEQKDREAKLQNKLMAKAAEQRKQDEEKAAVQRKKDAEKAEVQRKKDLSDAKKNADAWERKLQLKIKDLEDKVERLEQDATDQKLEAKQKHEATQRYIESLADDIDAATDFLAIGDEASLDRIKRRNLLDRVQATLASSLGLSDDRYLASHQFREALGPSSSLEERRTRLREMLDNKKEELPKEAAFLMNRPEALALLAERYHRVRLDGDQVAHGYRERSWYEGSVSRSSGGGKVGLTSLLDFISLPRQ